MIGGVPRSRQRGGNRQASEVSKRQPVSLPACQPQAQTPQPAVHNGGTTSTMTFTYSPIRQDKAACIQAEQSLIPLSSQSVFPLERYPGGTHTGRSPAHSLQDISLHASGRSSSIFSCIIVSAQLDPLASSLLGRIDIAGATPIYAHHIKAALSLPVFRMRGAVPLESALRFTD